MPEQVAEAIVRLEAHNLQSDEELANGQRESIALQRETLDVQRETLAMQRETLAAQQAALAVQQAMVRAMERIADRFDTLVLERRTPHGRLTALPTTESVLADWRQRLSVTEDVWTVAAVIAPVLVEQGELREPLESITARTGLSVRRVNECLRPLRKHACIRPRGGAGNGPRCTCSIGPEPGHSRRDVTTPVRGVPPVMSPLGSWPPLPGRGDQGGGAVTAESRGRPPRRRGRDVLDPLGTGRRTVSF
ncbi:hypothetical protein SUDANB176_03805 [Streptomyces sp. enrichment culture]